jgi:hypothetical protein
MITGSELAGITRACALLLVAILRRSHRRHIVRRAMPENVPLMPAAKNLAPTASRHDLTPRQRHGAEGRDFDHQRVGPVEKVQFAVAKRSKSSGFTPLAGSCKSVELCSTP